jgi:hypothetical protein
MKLYRKIEGNHEAKLDIYYRLGGYNDYHRVEEKRGIVMSFGTVEVNGIWEQSSPQDKSSFKVLLKPLNRKSDKQLIKVFDVIVQNQDEIFEHYINGDYNQLKDLIDGIKATL